jgi:uncharacterized protein (TIGR00369 family)
VIPKSLPLGPTVAAFRGNIDAVDENGCRIRYPFNEAWCNPKGTIQGGIFAVFLDDCMSYAVIGALGPEARFSTVSMNIDYLHPVASGEMIAVGRVTRVGRRVLFLEGEIENDGRRVARATSSALQLN